MERAPKSEPSRSGGAGIARWIAFLAAPILFIVVLARFDVRGGLALLRALGPKLAIAIVPYALAIGVDAWGWRRLLVRLGARPRLESLFALRIGTEALALSLPGGALVADAMKPAVLAHRWSIAISLGAASVAARKVWLVLTQGTLILLCVVVAPSIVSRIGGRSLVAAYAIVGAIFIALGLVARFSISGGRAASLLRRALAALPIPRLRAWLTARADAFARADAHLVDAIAAPLPTSIALGAPFFLGWIVEALDTWLLLHLVGIHLDVVTVVVVECALGVLRVIVFALPAGLGAQELAYFAILSALGVGDVAVSGAAFSLLKRAKEGFWLVTGWLALAVIGAKEASRPAEEGLVAEAE